MKVVAIYTGKALGLYVFLHAILFVTYGPVVLVSLLRGYSPGNPDPTLSSIGLIFYTFSLYLLPLVVVVTAIAWRHPQRSDWRLPFRILSWVPVAYWMAHGTIADMQSDDPYAGITSIFGFAAIPAALVFFVLGNFYEQLRNHPNLRVLLP